MNDGNYGVISFKKGRSTKDLDTTYLINNILY